MENENENENKKEYSYIIILYVLYFIIGLTSAFYSYYYINYN